MKKQILFIIATLLCAGCTPVKKNWMAVCGDGIVKIIDLSESGQSTANLPRSDFKRATSFLLNTLFS